MRHNDIIRSVTYILAADGVISKQEMRFLDDLRRRLGVPEEVVKTEIEKIKNGKGTIYLPQKPSDVKRLLGFLIQAAIVDGKIVFKEQHILEKVAAKIGITPKEVQQMITRRLKQLPSDKRDERSDEEKLPEILQELSSPQEREKTPHDSFQDLMATLQESHTTVCPKCGFAQNDAEVCARCGVNISWYVDGQAAQTLLDESGEGMVCPECGHVQKKARRCNRCGTYIKNYPQKRKPPPPRKTPTPEDVAKRVKQKRLFSKITLVCLIIIVIAGFIGYNILEQQKPQTVTFFNNMLQVTKPAGWTLESTLIKDAHVLLAHPDTHACWAVFTEGKFRSAYAKASLPIVYAYSSSSQTARKKPLRNPEIVNEPVGVMINGLKGIQYEFTGDIDDEHLKIVYTVFDGKTYFYQVLAQAPEAAFDLHRATFDEILRSFREL